MQDNVKKLRSYGYEVLDTDIGKLACGDVGSGKLLPWEPLWTSFSAITVKRDRKGYYSMLLAAVSETQILLSEYLQITNSFNGALATGGAESGFAIICSVSERNGVTADSAAIASVVPEAARSLTDCLKKALSIEPFLINHRADTGIAVKAVFSERVGTDRIVNACAAYHFYGGPVMVIDFRHGDDIRRCR